MNAHSIDARLHNAFASGRLPGDAIDALCGARHDLRVARGLRVSNASIDAVAAANDRLSSLLADSGF